MSYQPYLAESYSYRRLSENTGDIRLLQLHPGGSADPINCTLQHVHLSSLDDHDFETVSYCWGNIKETSIILVDNAPHFIPTSAEQALYRFRMTEVVRTLWLDSVCINQDDLGERAQQVQLMSRIYSSGTRNLIWLGEDDGTMQAAIHTIDDIMRHIRQATNDFDTFPKFNNDEHWKWHSRSGIPSNIDARGIKRLCARPWFSRLWVVQEAALSKVNLCHCGSYTFELLPLFRVARWLHVKRMHISASAWSMTAAVQRVSIMEDLADPEFGRYSEWLDGGSDADNEATVNVQPVLDPVIQSLQFFNAREPRDHVFGLLALYQRFQPRRQLPQLLRPDYTKAVADVFRDATKYALDEVKKLDLFNTIYYREPGSSICSWVPRWDQQWDQDVDPSHITPYTFKAHGGRLAAIEWRLQDPNKLPIKGIHMGPIKSVSQRYLVADSQESFSFSMLGRFIDQANDTIKEHSLSPYSNQFQTAIASTLCSGMNENWLKATADEVERYTDLCVYRATNGQMPPWPSGFDEYSESMWKAARFCKAARHACRNRKFFTTIDGRMGLGPMSTQVGDEVAILFGGEFPFVLRPCGEEYELVGLSYVHGVMDGEAVRMHEREDKEDTLFVIR